MRRVGVARRRRGLISAAAMVLGAALVTQVGPGQAGASTLPTRSGDGGEFLGSATRSTAPTSPAAVAAVPSGFVDNLVFDGLTLPTAIAFAPDGKVFVGEKSGIVKVFDSTSDPTATQVVDLRARVQDWWDRGLLGLGVDPRVARGGRHLR